MSMDTLLLPEGAGYPVLRTPIASEWLDHNGHMNVAAYLLVFDRACCDLSRRAGIGPENIASSGHTIFVGQANVVYRREVHRQDEIAIAARIRELSDDRLHLMLSMYRRTHEAQTELAAVCEELCVCVSMQTRRPAPFPEDVASFFKGLLAAEGDLPSPRIISGPISLAPRKPNKDTTQ